MNFQSEALRLVRHGIGPVVAYAVGAGLIPEALQGDVVSLLTAAAGILVPFVWSKARDTKK